MLRFCADQFIGISKFLEGTWAFSQFNSLAIGNSYELLPDHKDAFIKKIEWLLDSVKEIGLTMSAYSAERILLYLKENPKVDKKLEELIKDFNTRFQDELNSRHVIILAQDKDHYYNPDEPIIDKIILDKFPDIIEDISEAGNCYALNRNTACVFHLMRILEKAVQKLAISLDLSTILTCDKEWQIIINDIRGQLKTKYPKHADTERIKYENTLGHLETIKIAWRNPTMHPKATYTEEEAKALLSAVEIFLKDLVKIL